MYLGPLGKRHAMNSDIGKLAATGSIAESEHIAQSGGDAPSRFRPRTIGLFGPRAAGKTCYLSAALLGMSTSKNCTVVLANETSRTLLEHHWQSLDQGEVPAATELALKPLAGSAVISVPSPPQRRRHWTFPR